MAKKLIVIGSEHINIKHTNELTGCSYLNFSRYVKLKRFLCISWSIWWMKTTFTEIIQDSISSISTTAIVYSVS